MVLRAHKNPELPFGMCAFGAQEGGGSDRILLQHPTHKRNDPMDCLLSSSSLLLNAKTIEHRQRHTACFIKNFFRAIYH